jgi:ribosomal protein S25
MDQYTSVFDISKTNEVLKDRIKQLETKASEYINTNNVFILVNNALKDKIKYLEADLEKSNQKNKELEKKLLESNQKNKELKDKIDNIIDDNAVKVLEYFNDCSNIRKTADAFGFEIDELYHLIPHWDGCSDGLQGADDFDECRIDVLGRKIYEQEKEDEFTKEELEAEREQKMRTPDQDIINKMIDDYNKATNLTLYELADRYDLCINNLFRLLKENKIIEKETDAKGYGDFYREYLGSGHVWNGVSNELRLIEDFYKNVSLVNL